jgi:hypothetical protein
MKQYFRLAVILVVSAVLAGCGGAGTTQSTPPPQGDPTPQPNDMKKGRLPGPM